MVDFVNPIQQQYPDTCAIKSQQLILRDFGIDVTEDACVKYCYDHGWYVPGGGTLPQDVGNLLKDVGIPCTQRDEANIFDIMNEIQQGHKIIVGVDANELWKEGPINSLIEWLRDMFLGGEANHALIVAGLDYSNPDCPYVILTDPGSGEAGKPYPLNQFMDAWSDSNHFIVSTDIPTPKVANQFIANGMENLHLPQIAGVDHDTFVNFCDYSHTIDFSQMPTLFDAFESFPSNPSWSFNDALASFDLPLPTNLPLQPLSDPMSLEMQFNSFNSIMNDVHGHLLNGFDNVNFLDGYSWQVPSLQPLPSLTPVTDIFGNTVITDPMNVDIMSGIPSNQFDHSMVDAMNEQSREKLNESNILENERDSAVDNYHRAMDNGDFDEALKWETIANSRQQDLYNLWDTPQYGQPAIAPGIDS